MEEDGGRSSVGVGGVGVDGSGYEWMIVRGLKLDEKGLVIVIEGRNRWYGVNGSGREWVEGEMKCSLSGWEWKGVTHRWKEWVGVDRNGWE